MKGSYFNHSQEQISVEIENLQYRKPLGAFRPKFVGIPQDYVPLSSAEALSYALIVLLTIGSVLGVMIGFIFWITRYGLQGYVTVWSIIFLFFVLLMIPAFYVGGKNRIKEEKRLIVQAQQKQEEMKGRDRKKQQYKHS